MTPVAADVAHRNLHGVDHIGPSPGGHEQREQQRHRGMACRRQVGHCYAMANRDAEQFTTTTGWPWRTGHSFELLDGGGAFFPAMLTAIDAARESVLLEMYLVESGHIVTRFIAALGAAARRGARVCVVFDAFGSLGLSRADRRRLIEAGVELRFFNPLELRKRLGNLLRDHRKLLLTDGRTAFVGGTGLTDDFAPGAAHGPWHEVMVRIEGPVVADWQRAFARTWCRCGAALDLPLPRPLPPRAGAAGRLSLSGGAAARSVLANGVLRRIDGSTRRAWIMSAYFVPSRRVRARRSAARHAGEWTYAFCYPARAPITRG